MKYFRSLCSASAVLYFVLLSNAHSQSSYSMGIADASKAYSCLQHGSHIYNWGIPGNLIAPFTVDDPVGDYCLHSDGTYVFRNNVFSINNFMPLLEDYFRPGYAGYCGLRAAYDTGWELNLSSQVQRFTYFERRIVFYGSQILDDSGCQENPSAQVIFMYMSVLDGNHEPSDSGESCDNTSNPINALSGNKYFRYNDFQSPGDSLLALNRFYNSANVRKNWTFSYMQSVRQRDFSLKLYRSDGEEIDLIRDFNVSDELVWRNPGFENAIYAQIKNGEYEIRFKDGVIETYDSKTGKLSTVRRGNGGNVLTLTYQENSILVEQDGSILTLMLEGANNEARVIEATLPDGETISYRYRAASSSTEGLITPQVMTSVEYQDGSTVEYLYENDSYPNHITGVIDENGFRVSSVKYNENGRAISSEKGSPESGVERISIEYINDSKDKIYFSPTVQRVLTNALGKKTTLTYLRTDRNRKGSHKIVRVEGHQSENCAAANKNYTYYPNGLLETKTDWKNNTTSYQYNTRNLESSRTEALGTPQERTITTEWHPTFNLRTKITEPGRETVFIYDDEGRLESQSSNELAL